MYNTRSDPAHHSAMNTNSESEGLVFISLGNKTKAIIQDILTTVKGVAEIIVNLAVKVLGEGP